MTTNDFEPGQDQFVDAEIEEPQKSLLPLALVVGAAAAIILTLLTLI